MGRLSSVAVLCGLLGLAACEQNTKAANVTRERSQVVTSQAVAPPPVSAPAPAASSTPAPPRPAKKLCAGQLQKPGKPFPKLELSRNAAAGEREPPAKLAPAGNWTWINFWAAWCVPCKEEIPRLKSWEQRLNAAGRSFALVFVSLDDDPRQLSEFLASQPPSGLRSTYWLKEGQEREKWLEAATLSQDPELPVHLLVDPAGKIRCVVEGAVEDSDYEQVLALVQ